MLSSRSARLAAMLLLVLLFGWTMRAWRKGQTTILPGVKTPAVENSPNTQPDE
ncbi:hypothetical protein [Prosthecobacter sp.]|jgi:hypothetical protein|uniref:hypothetical protein n=1 Tax=Prosthecobacter sp. TaxID=1965333 RepID=UPI0037849072